MTQEQLSRKELIAIWHAEQERKKRRKERKQARKQHERRRMMAQSPASSHPSGLPAEEVARLAERIYARAEGELEELPTVPLVRRFREKGVPERDVRRFLTFICAMNRDRRAVPLWRASEKLFDTHPEAFDPEKATAMPDNSLRKLLEDYGVSQKHGPDSRAWRQIAGRLRLPTDSVARLVEGGEGDAKEVYPDSVLCELLGGDKISPMWIRILFQVGRARIRNMEVVPVAVDTHVRRVTEELGVTATAGLPMSRARPIIQAAWRAGVAKANFGGPPGLENTCAALDPALWWLGQQDTLRL